MATLFKPHKIRVETDYRKLVLYDEQYIREQTQRIDLTKMSGRIKYYRILRGYSQMELGRRLGYKDPKAYGKAFESRREETSDFQKVRMICNVLQVSEEVIFDEYMKFLATDYKTDLLVLQGNLEKTNSQMDGLFGNTRGQYKKWIEGKVVPSRRSVERIQEVFEKYQ
ncbi:MAG: hypothetical protein PUH02_07880 [bacterium]|nr:hypothetical protein [bacterium]